MDAHGLAIARHLDASGVATTPDTIGLGSTSVALATIDADGAASYSFSIEWDPAPLDVATGSFDALHVGSIGAALEPGATTVERLLCELQPTVTTSFDPNIRPQLLGSAAAAQPRVERLVALADIVKASDEDLAWLYPDDTVAQVMERWLALGPAVVVVTRGADGADALAASGPIHVMSPENHGRRHDWRGRLVHVGIACRLERPRPARRRTTADAARLTADQLTRVVQFAAGCAAITVSRPGADPPRRGDLPSPDGWSLPDRGVRPVLIVEVQPRGEGSSTS